MVVGRPSQQEMTLHAPPCHCAVDYAYPTVDVEWTGLLILFYGIVYALNLEGVVLIRPIVSVVR